MNNKLSDVLMSLIEEDKISRKTISLILVVIMILMFPGCSSANNEQLSLQPTGDGSNIDQPHVFYNNGLYAYYATGFDEDLPDGYQLVGQIKAKDNSVLPAEELASCQVEVGQNVYALKESPENIYIEYDNGCALFSLKKGTSNES